jgi:hypothetical protein
VAGVGGQQRTLWCDCTLRADSSAHCASQWCVLQVVQQSYVLGNGTSAGWFNDCRRALHCAFLHLYMLLCAAYSTWHPHDEER